MSTALRLRAVELQIAGAAAAIANASGAIANHDSCPLDSLRAVEAAEAALADAAHELELLHTGLGAAGLAARCDAARQETNALRARAAALADTCWMRRSTDADAQLKMMLRELAEEGTALDREAAADASAAAVLSPPHPSAPGQRAAGAADMSAAACGERLLQLALEDAAAAVTSSVIGAVLECGRDAGDELVGPSPPLAMADARDAAERRRDIDDARLALQRGWRHFDPRDVENWGDAFHSRGEADQSRGGTSARVAAVLASSPCPRDVEALERARRLQSLLLRDSDSRNAQEGFVGYTRATQRQLAALSVGARVRFVALPTTTYPLGDRLSTRETTLLPMAGSDDASARLDRRTQLWLLRRSSRITCGTAFRGGPMHYCYHSVRRDVRVHAYHVMERPLTKSQFRMLARNHRFAAALSGLLHGGPSADDSPLLQKPSHPLYIPSITDGVLAGVIATPRCGAEGGDDEEHDILEVPFSIADTIAAALGGVVCPVDVWEAAVRGVDGAAHLIDAATLAQLDPQLLRWRLRVDAGAREVRGASWRIAPSRAARRALSSVVSPFGLRDVARCGLEWNAVVDVSVSDTAPSTAAAASSREQFPPPLFAAPNGEYVPTTHVLRSLADHGTQLVLDGALEDADAGPRNDRCFVGPTCDTYSLPNRGLPVACFRVAFPVFAEGRVALEQQLALQRRKIGADLDAPDLIGALGTPLARLSEWNGDLVLSDEHTDELYGHRTFLFPLAGFDLTFRAEVPHELVTVTLHSVPMVPPPVSLVDRRPFSGGCTVRLLRCGAVSLPCVGEAALDATRRRVRNAGVELLVDNAVELAFRDVVERRDGRWPVSIALSLGSATVPRNACDAAVAVTRLAVTLQL